MAASSSSSRPVPPQSKGALQTILPKLSKTEKKKHSSLGKLPSVQASASAATIVSGGTTRVAPTSRITSAANDKKKKKRHSPFRIKVGCIVALRYREGGNHLKQVGIARATQSYAHLWTDPHPARDQGLALIGRRVRCCFPKSVLSNSADQPESSTRILEGEIISLVDYEAQWQAQQLARNKREPCCTTVQLLVHRKALKLMPFLKRTDEDIDTSNMNATEKKRQHFEEVIRGKDMVTVKVNLADASGIHAGTEEQSKKDLQVKWVIRKRIPTSWKDSDGNNGETIANGRHQNAASDGMCLSGSVVTATPPRKKRKSSKDATKSTTHYLGNGNDSRKEQERNWRWLAARYDDLLLSTGRGTTRSPDELSSGFLGEVLKVEPTLSPVNGESHTLATVTLRRLILPEHTISGRLSHHDAVEIFDDADGSSSETSRFQVPVEELVIVCRKLRRKLDTTNGDASVGKGLSCPVVSRSYSYSYNNFSLLTTSKECAGWDESFDSCHQCISKMDETKKQEPSATNAAQNQTNHERQMETTELANATPGNEFDCLFTLQVQDAMASLYPEKKEIFQERGKSTSAESKICASCGASCLFADSCQSCSSPMHSDCTDWNRAMDRMNGSACMDHGILCRLCRNDKSQILKDMNCENESVVGSALRAASVMRPVDFDLPRGFIDFESIPDPSEQLIVATKPKRRKHVERAAKRSGKGATDKKPHRKSDKSSRRLVSRVEQVEYAPPRPFESDLEEEVFVPSCSRLMPYDPAGKRFSDAPKRLMQLEPDGSSNNQVEQMPPTDEVGRSSYRRARENERVNENKSTSRAARANQRRLKKGVAALGASGLHLDSLADREQKLRFDRSSIHAWGVFADENINAGDMVVEYRGELIGNAVAEKREAEYQEAKIGSDYMFRVDGTLVCDATKQGNVARFINASCDPNCYTQIITLNGNKRIVIYAKRDIKAGEELCYDYKFPFEFDEGKRIECHCGARDCRGYMNWDKRYLDITS